MFEIHVRLVIFLGENGHFASKIDPLTSKVHVRAHFNQFLQKISVSDDFRIKTAIFFIKIGVSDKGIFRTKMPISLLRMNF